MRSVNWRFVIPFALSVSIMVYFTRINFTMYDQNVAYIVTGVGWLCWILGLVLGWRFGLMTRKHRRDLQRAEAERDVLRDECALLEEELQRSQEKRREDVGESGQ